MNVGELRTALAEIGDGVPVKVNAPGAPAPLDVTSPVVVTSTPDGHECHLIVDLPEAPAVTPTPAAPKRAVTPKGAAKRGKPR